MILLNFLNVIFQFRKHHKIISIHLHYIGEMAEIRKNLEQYHLMPSEESEKIPFFCKMGRHFDTNNKRTKSYFKQSPNILADFQ